MSDPIKVIKSSNQVIKGEYGGPEYLTINLKVDLPSGEDGVYLLATITPLGTLTIRTNKDGERELLARAVGDPGYDGKHKDIGIPKAAVAVWLPNEPNDLITFDFKADRIANPAGGSPSLTIACAPELGEIAYGYCREELLFCPRLKRSGNFKFQAAALKAKAAATAGVTVTIDDVDRNGVPTPGDKVIFNFEAELMSQSNIRARPSAGGGDSRAVSLRVLPIAQ